MLLSDKKQHMWVHKCYRSRKSEGSYGRNSNRRIFVHSKLRTYLETLLGIPEDKQLPGTLCLASHVVMGDESFPLKTSLLKPYPRSQSKGDNEKSISNYMLSRSRVVENALWILIQKFQIYQRTLQSLSDNADIIFVKYILHSNLRDEGVGLSDMGSSADNQSNLTKCQNKEAMPTEVLLK